MRTFAPKAIAFTALVAVSTLAPISTASAQPITLAINTKKHAPLLSQTAQKVAVAETPANTTEVKPAEVKKPSEVKVVVKDGDSLSSIAEANGTTWVRLYNANESVANPNVINPGQELRVPSADEQLADRPLPVVQPVAPVASPTYQAYSAPARTYAPATGQVTGNAAKDYIYSRESGNNPNATNPSGCYGIGQDCNGVLRAQCGADWACQDAYFTSYAERRYGGWEGAYNFWQANHWW